MKKNIIIFSTLFVALSVTAYVLYKKFYKDIGTDKLKLNKAKSIEIEIKKDNSEIKKN